MGEQSPSKNLEKYSTATLAEASCEVAVLASLIVPLFHPIHVSGPAYPVSMPPGDNLAIHLAVAEAPAGTILVAATGGNLMNGFWGEILMEAALARGIRGLVTDGAVRDTRAIRARKFPVFCGGIAIPGTTKKSGGVLNRPVLLANIRIGPGDFIVGDDDGVVVIPKKSLAEVAEQAETRAKKETLLIKQLQQGQLTIDLLNLRESRIKRDE